MKKILRPYQIKAIDSICDGFNKDKKQLCVLPTGSGKTVIFSNIIKKLKCKTLIIAHTKELIEQISKTLSIECDGITHQIYKSRGKYESEVIICSIQSAIRKGSLKNLKNQEFDLLVIDECHRSCSKSYRKIIDYLGFNNKKLLGVTATPFRTDSQSVYEIFGFPTFSMSIINMIEEGFIVDFSGYRIKTNISIHGIRKSKGDFISSKLDSIINVKNRNQIIINEYAKLASGEKTIAFCVSIKHAQDLKKEFLLRGISCENIDGKMSFFKRKNILERFKNGDIKVITNCNLLTEGFDEPSVSCLLMCRPTISKSLYIQMIGRGSRLYPDKNLCKVIEFTDNDFDVCNIASLCREFAC